MVLQFQNHGPLLFENTTMTVLPDLSTQVTKQQAKCIKAKWRLHVLTIDVKYVMLYLAQLWDTFL